MPIGLGVIPAYSALAAAESWAGPGPGPDRLGLKCYLAFVFYVTKSLALEKRLEKKRDTITMEFNVTVCDLSPRRRTKDDKGD